MLVETVVVIRMTEAAVTQPCVRERCGGKGNMFAWSNLRRCPGTMVKI